MKKHINLILLLVILSVSLFVRFYKLSTIPPSLNWDEISHGYNAYSVLNTGKDEWGASFPIIFRAYGDYKLPLYIYLTALFEFLFGLNPFSVRLISAVSGVGLVFLSYLITQKVFKNKTVSLMAALLAALSSWGLFLSRVAVEANLGAFLFALGMYFVLSWQEKFRSKDLVLTAIFWGLSLHAYNSARVLVPIFLILTGLLAFKAKKAKQLVVFFLIFFIFLIPIITQVFNRSAQARYGLVSLVDQGTINQIIASRQSSKLPGLVSKIMYNRPVYFIISAAKNYFANLSPRYLFFRGGSHYQFSLPDHELLYLVTAPFLLAGLFWTFFRGGKAGKIIGLWFLAGFIPSAITKDAPHVLRGIFVLPTPFIISAIGFAWIVGKLKNKSGCQGKLLILVFVFSILFCFSRWWRDYQNIYPKAYSWAWQYGYQEAVAFVKEKYSDYDKIYFSKRYGEPHEFVLFYFPWSPEKYQNDKEKTWDYHADWYWVDRFDKFIFVNDWEIKNVKCLPAGKAGQMSNVKCLLVTSPGNYPNGWSKIKVINFLDGKIAFEILEND